MFDPALTGRENAMTAAIIAGLRRSDARRVLTYAVEFAELEEWADAPMRVYKRSAAWRNVGPSSETLLNAAS
jgi:ABC-type polysaccharide/polyol phosphate transport system ATPase subunit